ncbi:hypothetical protein KUCAC02_026452, partial [Chaenocephalus aceratus]
CGRQAVRRSYTKPARFPVSAAEQSTTSSSSGPGSFWGGSTSRHCLCVSRVTADSLSPPVNVTISAVKANSAVVTWDIPEGDPVIGFAITQQKKDVRMLRFIQEVNTTTRSCALWDLEEETDYIVHVQSISMSGSSPLSEPLRFRTPKEAKTQASKSK